MACHGKNIPCRALGFMGKGQEPFSVTLPPKANNVWMGGVRYDTVKLMFICPHLHTSPCMRESTYITTLAR